MKSKNGIRTVLFNTETQALAHRVSSQSFTEKFIIFIILSLYRFIIFIFYPRI